MCLLSIINERKSQYSNFQLIIITHDENFLRKLGQSDVMEYYWLAFLSFIVSHVSLPRIGGYPEIQGRSP